MGSLFSKTLQGIVGLSILTTLSAPLPAVQAQLGKVTNTSPAGGAKSHKNPPGPALMDRIQKVLGERPEEKEGKRELKRHFTIMNDKSNWLIAYVNLDGDSSPVFLYYDWRKRNTDEGLSKIESINFKSAIKTEIKLQKSGETKFLKYSEWNKNIEKQDLKPEKDCSFVKIGKSSPQNYQLKCKEEIIKKVSSNDLSDR